MHCTYYSKAAILTCGVCVLGNFDFKSPSFRALLNVACLCNNASYETVGDTKERKLKGDASEKGITRFIDPHFDMQFEAHREQATKIWAIPFNSANKWQLSVHAMPNTHQLLLVLKGAPDVVITFCDKYLVDGKPQAMDQATLNTILAGIKRLGGMGERVLAFCQLELDPLLYTKGFEFKGGNKTDVNVPLGQGGGPGLVFVGLMSMIDPPREGVPEAVIKCR